ncbi:uncharacterized protein [Nicotiana tomentosiformis]|uniref:uncharacterized protein n=1 Tax=Nicotiana tomentosiformis TaxID=4098 RepID=UPI00388CDBF8
MLQAQQVAIAQLQNLNRAPSTVEPDPPPEVTRRDQPITERSNENELGANPEIIKKLEELTKRIKSGEKKIEANDKKVETYNSRVDQIPGAPPILKGLDSKKFVQNPFPPSAAPKLIPKKFRIPEIPKYNETTDSNEHVTSYRCAIKGNALEDDEIESVLLKKFGETLSKGAMIWYHNLSPNSIDYFAMLADSFVKAHARAIKVETRKSDLFKVRQNDNEMLREFVSRFQMNRMDLPLVADDWAVQAFTQGLNVRSSVASQQLKQNLIEYPAVTWADEHNRYQSKIKVEDDQLGAPSGTVYPIRPIDRIKRDIDREPRSNRDRYQPYNRDRRGNGSERNSVRNERRNDRGSSTNIIRSRVVEQLGLQDQIVPAVRVLNGFNMACETTRGEITLPVNAAGNIQEAKFYVIEGDIRYNTLFGRPLIYNMRAVLSTLHQVLKFPTPGGIKTIYGEQPAAKEMFAVDEVIPISILTSSKEPRSEAKQEAK